MIKSDTYWGGALIIGILVFVGVWIYAMTEWGFLMGIIFGWIPALIAGFIGGLLWPVIIALIFIFIFATQGTGWLIGR